MSLAHPDRVQLSTSATTIVRAPIGRGKSSNNTAAFWATLPELTSRETQERTAPNDDTNQLIPISSVSALPWRDAVTSSFDVVSSPTRRNLLNALPSSKTLTGSTTTTTAYDAVRTPNIGAMSFRRPGVVSAPVHSPSSAAAAGAAAFSAAAAAQTDRRCLPIIQCGSRAAAASISGAAPQVAALPSALKGTRRNLVPLPSIHSATADTSDSSLANVTFTSFLSKAAAAAAAAAGSPSDDEEERLPIVVSYVHPRPESGKRAAHRSLSRPSLRVIVSTSASGGDGTSDGEQEDVGELSVEPSNATGTSTAVTQSRAGGLVLRGIRRLFGKEAAKESLTTPAAAHTSSSGVALGDPTTGRQDDLMVVAGGEQVQRSAISVVQLAQQHDRELERVHRVRSSLLGSPLAATRITGKGGVGLLRPIPKGHDARIPAHAAASSSSTAVSLSPSAEADRVASHARTTALQESIQEPHHVIRSGKSFTQMAIDDPHNPVSKTAKQLATLQEQLSYMANPYWRERAAESVTHERPILMAEGWKV